MVRTRWSGTRKCSFHRMNMFSLCATSRINTGPLRACFWYGRKALNFPQCERSILSVAPQLSCFVIKLYFVPIISPSKYVVSVGWSSVSPAGIHCQRHVAQRLEDPVTRTLNAEVSTEKRLPKIHMLDLDLDVINLPLRLLCAVEFAARSQIGWGRGRNDLNWENMSDLELQ